MNRRNFLRSMLGVAAATALPSEIWPFRKIFVPANPKPIDLTGLPVYVVADPGTWLGLSRSPYPGRLSVPLSQQITELELEHYGKQLSALLMRTSPLYELFRRHAAEIDVKSSLQVRTPMMRIPVMAQVAVKPNNLIHAPATPDNIMEFIDGLDSDLS